MYLATEMFLEAELAYRREQMLKARSPRRVWRRRGQRTARTRSLPQARRPAAA
jgi:hypothetical protein